MVGSINRYSLGDNTQKFIKLIISENFTYQPIAYSSKILYKDISKLLEKGLTQTLNYIVK